MLTFSLFGNLSLSDVCNMFFFFVSCLRAYVNRMPLGCTPPVNDKSDRMSLQYYSHWLPLLFDSHFLCWVAHSSHTHTHTHTQQPDRQSTLFLHGTAWTWHSGHGAVLLHLLSRFINLLVPFVFGLIYFLSLSFVRFHIG